MNTDFGMLLYICFQFMKIGLFTFGGGYGMIPIMHHEFVTKLKWLTPSQFLDAAAIGQVTPGPVAIMATFIGFKFAGVPGAVSATIGIFLPSVVVVYLAGRFYARYRRSHLMEHILPTINAAVVGLLAAAAVMLSKPAIINIATVGIGLLTFLVVIRTKISPTWLILGSGLIGWIFFR
ncbi:MAG: chromate transporter [bacterium]|nr:chromate transporter [bacterium]